jgi:putative nucleotidyltransferase with HDIG domain
MAIPANLLNGISRLDPLPITLQRLMRAVDDENVGTYQVGEIVQFDHAAVASLLRAANSAAFGGWARTDSVVDAVGRLGKARVMNVVLGDHVKTLNAGAPLYDLTEDELGRHSAAVSLAVRAIILECPKAGLTEFAAIAGLLHDVGKLVMVRYMKADLGAIQKVRTDRHLTFVQAERELLGCDHAEVGGAMAKHWGFPPDIQEAILRHHEIPLEQSTPVLDAVVVANMAAKAIGIGLGAEGQDMVVDENCQSRLHLNFAGFSRVCVHTLFELKELDASMGGLPLG